MASEESLSEANLYQLRSRLAAPSQLVRMRHLDRVAWLWSVLWCRRLPTRGGRTIGLFTASSGEA